MGAEEGRYTFLVEDRDGHTAESTLDIPPVKSGSLRGSRVIRGCSTSEMMECTDEESCAGAGGSIKAALELYTSKNTGSYFRYGAHFESENDFANESWKINSWQLFRNGELVQQGNTPRLLYLGWLTDIQPAPEELYRLVVEEISGNRAETTLRVPQRGP
jgi:hypothetical protein